jgi:hypothetical protein
MTGRTVGPRITPADLIQVIERPSIAKTDLLMR